MRSVLFAVAAVARCAAHGPQAAQRGLSLRISRALASCPRDARGMVSPEEAVQKAFEALSADSTDEETVSETDWPQGEFYFGPGFEVFANRFEVFANRAEIATEAALSPRCDATAMHSLGLLYHLGVGGVGQDARLSAAWHAAAAAQGHLDALATIGGCARAGAGCAEDIVAGLKIIEACASAGVPTGLNKLGALYESGDYIGVADCGKALDCFEAAGGALGLFNVGHALFYGVGVAADEKRATECWLESASLAPDDGADEAAFALYTHRLVEKPLQMLRLAAALEHPPALEEEARRRR
ncbi:hypothetical protein M885DRAFT_529479 [Pelagophyceae sp. CCMP2097]|nr:hypothetical protein M885DRAFT_529479 [Pelagophyceae sp. CCMP2097]